MSLRVAMLCLALAAGGVMGQTPVQTRPVESPLEIAKQQFRDGEYVRTIVAVDRAFARRDYEPGPVELYELLMLRAESLIQLRRTTIAADAFTAAEEAAPDLARALLANANALAIEYSVGASYRPVGTQEAIDILDRDARKQAMRMLLTDLTPRARQEYQAAIQATTVAPVESAMQTMYDLYSLDYATETNNQDIPQAIVNLSDHVYKLFERELRRAGGEINFYDRLASAYDDFSGARRGFSSRERDSLEDLLDYLALIEERVLSYHGVAARMENDSQRWERMAAQTVELINRLELLLDTRI